MIFGKLVLALTMSVAVLAACSRQSGGSADASSVQAIGATSYKVAGPKINAQQVGMVNNDIPFALNIPAGASVASAQWSFGDGTAVVNGVGPLNHRYSRAGIYQVQVSVLDANQNEMVVNHTLNVVGFMDGMTCLPELLLITPEVATVGVPVDLRVNVPGCLSRTISSIQWNYGDNSANGAGANVQHKYNSSGQVVVTVQIMTPSSPNRAWVTLSQVIDVVPAPTPTPTPVPSATPSSTPVPAICEVGATRETVGANYTRDVACGRDGKKSVVYRDRIAEVCQFRGEAAQWVQSSSSPEVVSEGACLGQSCQLPDGSSLVDGGSKILYSTQTPTGSCDTVAQSRVCSNGVLGGSTTQIHAVCRNGCGDFGADGSVKIGVVVGDSRVALACAFGEEAYSVYNQIADQTCQSGVVVTSNQRQGALKSEGACPTYAWVPSENWTACSANCGGSQARIFDCRDSKGSPAPSERCGAMQPNETRICDGNPEAVRRSESSTVQESAGGTHLCPADQIGVTISKRDVTTTTIYACIDHQVQQESQNVSHGEWVSESYCRDYTAYRCSQDSLTNNEAKGRFQWMIKCQDNSPVIKEFLTQFAGVTLKGPAKDNFVAKIDGKSRILYPTFMNAATNPEKVWKAPKAESASCDVPPMAYVAGVCVSSCATPDQELLAQAEANMKLRYVSFIEALTQKYKFAATLSGGSMSSRKTDRTAVDSWVTEMVDSEHDIRVFTMESGRSLRLTMNHPVVTAQGSIKLAQDFRVGESLVQLGGELDEIVSINDVKYVGKVYNLFVKSADPLKNIVVTNGYLNGTAYFQNEGAKDVNRLLLRNKLIKGVFGK